MARPEVTGRAPTEVSQFGNGCRGTADRRRARTEFRSFAMPTEFSRAHYYNLKRRGLGPDETDVAGVIIITAHNAARWRRQRDKAGRV